MKRSIASALIELDRIDALIVALLQRDARISNTALAAAVNLSQSACRARVKRIEADGVIRGYTAILDDDRLGLPIKVFASIALDEQGKNHAARFEARINALPEATECHVVSGATDYIVRFVCRDIARYNALTEALLADQDLGMKQIVSRFLLKTTKAAAPRDLRALGIGRARTPAA